MLIEYPTDIIGEFFSNTEFINGYGSGSDSVSDIHLQSYMEEIEKCEHNEKQDMQRKNHISEHGNSSKRHGRNRDNVSTIRHKTWKGKKLYQ